MAYTLHDPNDETVESDDWMAEAFNDLRNADADIDWEEEE